MILGLTIEVPVGSADVSVRGKAYSGVQEDESLHIVDQIVAQNLGVYRASPTRLREDIAQETQVASDYRGRLAYELLQNADDAMEGRAGQRDHVKFLLTDDALWMANNGRPLSDADVQGLCGLGASSKIDPTGTRRASIGHKGLGFKSVLEITERPSAMSPGIVFELSEDTARTHIDELFSELELDVPKSLPVMRFPALLSEEPDEWRVLQQEDFTTAFRFPFRPQMDVDSRSTLAESLLTLPLTTVLFLKHLDQVEIEVSTHDRSEKLVWQVEREHKVDHAWQPVGGLTGSGLFRVQVSSSEGETGLFLLAHDGDVEIGDHRSGLSGPAWDGVTVSEVSVAVLEPGNEVGEMPKAWRHFHVFLPTAEPSPYPILVNGAFTTDLSRQAVRVNEADDKDYNAHLIRKTAALFADRLLPILADHRMEHVVAVLDRDLHPEESIAARELHQAIVSEVSGVPLLPTETGDLLALNAAVFPPSVLGDDGVEFRRLLVDDASWDGRRFPASFLCAGRWSKVGTDHGAIALNSPDAITALADQVDDESAKAIEHESGGFELDPVLEICSSIYMSAPTDDQPAVRKRARSEPLFPTVIGPDRTFERVRVEGQTAFFPPRSARHRLPLSGLQFLAHSVCWGALLPNERKEYLGDQLDTWRSLFEIEEFEFREVMRAAVLPSLTIRSTEQSDAQSEDLKNMDALTAICQLAGRFPKPDRPLRYQRLGTDRALFNLSRLPVPCRGVENDETQWVPAYRAYFGKDWIGEESVETLSDALSAHDPDLSLPVSYLVSPDEFLGRLEDLPSEESTLEDEVKDEEDEVDLEEDFDSTMESDESSAWMAFLQWIGVNAVLRPVHFHDVEDRESGWLTTKELAQPKGWAFRELGGAWEAYRTDLVDGDTRLSDDEFVPYFYELHDLEGLVTVLGAAERDRSGQIGSALAEHLVRHWGTLEPLSEVTVALVKKGLYPSQRTRPPKAKSDELARVGDNFWIHRLKTRSYFPTSHGPRRPDQTWLMSEDVERRFGRRGQKAQEMVPIFDLTGDLPARQVKTVCTRLGVRTALTPATFTLDDARLLCRRLESLVEDGQPSDAQLREVIRPAYRELFELLSGRSSDPASQGSLREEPLLAGVNGQFAFEPAHEVLYSSTPGFLQRSGLHDHLSTFVIEADPSARAPLARLFETRNLEEALEWLPDPGESPFDEAEHQTFRDGLSELMPQLLARVRVERTNPQDGRILQDFAAKAEPVSELELHCRLDGQSYWVGSAREYYVRRGSRSDAAQIFILWEGEPWPPQPDEAQRLAMALADALEVNLVEAFLALIQSEKGQRWRLLEIAGGIRFLDEARVELQAADGVGAEDDEDTEAPAKKHTTSPLDDPTDEKAADIEAQRQPPPSQVELVSFEDLWIEGEPILVFGEDGSSAGDRERPGGESSGGGGMSDGRAAPGTDLVSLDALGMRIATAYEVNRLRKMGRNDVVALPGATGETMARSLVVDVSTPRAISSARSNSAVADATLESLRQQDISPVHPGFDILTIVDGEVERLIELKSSTVDAKVQSMTWNEWKSARASGIRELFWLYLVGNLRADISAPPYLRAVRDPFGSLYSEEVSEERISRAVQLRVREFDQAEELVLVGQPELSP